jgi:glycosyltransferase involved in cell wall biosynthesis
MKLSIVVPLNNEAQVIPDLVAALTSLLNQKVPNEYEILLVNDGSTDGSDSILKELVKNDSHLKVLELTRNFGQTAALAAGIDHATGEIIVTMDGDLQHDPQEIPRFLEKIEQGFDLVSGWRQTRTDQYLLRRLPSKIANQAMRFISGVPFRDFGSTYKAYRSEVIKGVELFGELHRFIPVLAAQNGAKMTEIPITVHPRKLGSSKYGLNRTFGVFQDLFFLYFYANYITKPMRGFGKLFLIFFGLGLSLSLLLLSRWWFGAISGVWERPALLLCSVLFMIVGIQFLVTGILAELLARIHFASRGSRIYTLRKIIHAGTT